jgi:CBS domain-containing protein
MPIIRTVGGIVEIHPALPVSPRPPVTQADADRRRDRAEDGERQDSDHAAHLAQQAHQPPASNPAFLAQDIMTSPVTSLPSDSMLSEAWAMMQHKGIHHLQ